MPHEYQRNPFDTSEPVLVFQNCHLGGARDLGFIGIQGQVMRTDNNGNVLFGNNGRILFNGTGTPVYAVEDGIVVSVNRTSTCYDRNRGRCGAGHNIVVKGSDGYYTEYQHVYPADYVMEGTRIQMGDFLGNVDNSGNTDGPHVHFARYNPNPNLNPNEFDPADRNYSAFGGTCDWTMLDVVPPGFTGWQEYNGDLYYFMNGLPAIGGFRQYDNNFWLELNNTTGAWTMRVWYRGNGRFYHWNGQELVPE